MAFSPSSWAFSPSKLTNEAAQGENEDFGATETWRHLGKFGYCSLAVVNKSRKKAENPVEK